MALQFDLTKIDNFEELCFDGDYISSETNTMIWGLCVIGMNDISEKNWEEVAFRLCVNNALFDLNNRWDLETCKYVKQAVKNHIGLTTNVAPITRTKFIKNCQESFEKSLSF